MTETFVARTLDGKPIVEAAAIVPIWIEDSPGHPRLLATGFYVTTAGHVLTARHAIEELIQTEKPGFALYWPSEPEGSGHVRWLKKVSYHNVSDLAVVALDHPPYGYLTNPVPHLTTQHPRAGSRIVTCAYNQTSGFRGPERRFEIAPTYVSGQFEEAHPHGRDSVMMPWPCYRASMLIPGGTSGGPAFDEQGRVFGVNSSNYEGTDITYLARINEALDLTAHDVGPNITKYERTLRELVREGQVILEE